jgi:anti-anti-sigma factor
MHTSLHFGTTVAGDRRILAISGELDMAVSELFEQELLAAVAATRPGGELVIDLSGVQFFDIKSLRVLLTAARAARAARVPLRLAASSAVDRVFEALGFDAARVPDGSPGTPPALWAHSQPA